MTLVFSFLYALNMGYGFFVVILYLPFLCLRLSIHFKMPEPYYLRDLSLSMLNLGIIII